MKQVRFGIIGCGIIAERFAKALKRSPAAQLYACAAREHERADAFAKKHGAKKAYGHYQAILEDKDVDAIYIATVHTTHARIARESILAGKPVLCEKPFFTNEKEGEEIISLAREKQILTMEGFWTRTLPAYHKAKDWIKNGKIGEIRLIRTAFCFPFPYTQQTKNHRLWNPKVGGGALLDAGVYPYQYVTGIMDAPPEEVNAAIQYAPSGVDATVSMILKYPSAMADCLTSINGYMDTTAILSGTQGYIKQYHFLGTRKAELYDNQNELIECFEDPEEEGFVHEIAHFVSLLHAGKTESAWIPLNDTLDFARCADSILGKLEG